MRSFELFLDVLGDWVPISLPINSPQSVGFSTYDEKLDESENSQYTLTFSIIKEKYSYPSIEQNPLLSFFFLGARVYLVLDGSKRIDFIIKDIVPTTYQSNAAYQLTAQDEFSYLLAKHRQGYNYSTINSEGILTPKSVFTIAEEVFTDCFISEWTISTKSVDSTLFNLPITLEVTNSNPYNVIIEAANSVNSYISVNYYSHQIDFYRKDLVKFSGYRYNRNYNAVDYKASYSNDEFATMLHVNGGTDADDMQVTIIPAMPQSVRKYFYEKTNNGKQWDELLNSTEKSFSWETVQTDIEKNPDFYYPRFSPAFLPFVAGDLTWGEENYIRWDINKKSEDQDTFDVWIDSKWGTAECPLITSSYNDIKGRYESIISFDIDFGNDGKKDNYKIVIISDPTIKNGFPNADLKLDGLNQRVKYYFAWNWTLFINGIKENISNTKVIGKDESGANILGLNKKLTLWQNKTDIEKGKASVFEKEEKALKEFFAVAERIPYLGQSLVDFTPYRPYMTKNQWNNLDNMINVIWRNCNIKIQYYTSEFYNAATLLTQIRSKINIYAENYLAACDAYRKSLRSNSESEGLESAIDDIEAQQNNLRDLIVNSNYLTLIQALGTSTTLSIASSDETEKLASYASYYFEQEREKMSKSKAEYIDELTALASSSSQDQYGNSQIQAERDYLTNKIKTLSDFVDDTIVIEGQSFSGAYALIVSIIRQAANDIVSKLGDAYQFEENGLAYQYEAAQQSVNHQVLAPLYKNYGQFVYELSYDNSTEIDSASLYNQALSYFIDINRAKASHSLEVLDIGTLEQVNIPRLTVGSKIQVYNPDSINALPYQSLLAQINHMSIMSQIKPQNAETYQIHKNELMEQLRYQYCSYNNIPITDTNTAQTIDFNEVMNRIYYDEVLVTGISRTLREPLKDSVTVQQPSRYKTILAKLIKSI